MGRYLIHGHADVPWTLVFDAAVGRGHVEKAGPYGARLRYTIQEFENSDKGKLPGDRQAVDRPA